MTPDVEQIRAALTAATELPNNYEEWVQANKAIRANAPVWLAQLCTEVERLRAEAKDLFRSFPICSLSMQGGECSAEDRWKEVVAIVVAERDAWRACADQLAYALMHYFSEPPKPALVVYEKLKGADS